MRSVDRPTNDQDIVEILRAVLADDIVSGTITQVGRPHGAAVRLDGRLDLASAGIGPLDVSWCRRSDEVIQVGRRITAEVIAVDEERERIGLSLAATENPELWALLKGLRPGEVLGGEVADVQRLGVFVAPQSLPNCSHRDQGGGAARRRTRPSAARRPGVRPGGRSRPTAARAYAAQRARRSQLTRRPGRRAAAVLAVVPAPPAQLSGAGAWDFPHEREGLQGAGEAGCSRSEGNGRSSHPPRRASSLGRQVQRNFTSPFPGGCALVYLRSSFVWPSLLQSAWTRSGDPVTSNLVKQLVGCWTVMMSLESVPLKYAQLVHTLQRRIESGDYPPGALLPSENQLIQEFGGLRPVEWCRSDLERRVAFNDKGPSRESLCETAK
ncbi:S1 RNA-binding domain-containing protein [Nonomuraea sp. NPDC049695]|uniref:S1 RNA-binding domain-containing protein n=1 Tax=Nonomuraea sp. NPDC049695 TaxID=3154734 RepID=UPI0034144420